MAQKKINKRKKTTNNKKKTTRRAYKSPSRRTKKYFEKKQKAIKNLMLEIAKATMDGKVVYNFHPLAKKEYLDILHKDKLIKKAGKGKKGWQATKKGLIDTDYVID